MKRSFQNILWSEQGTATIEFAAASLVFMFLTFATVEYGTMFNERMAVTALTRESASLASRQLTTNANILAMMASTEGALGLKSHPEKYQIFLAQVNGATAAGNSPQCTVVSGGTLTHADITAPDPGAQCDLPNNLYNLLEWNNVINAPGINQFTVMRVHYQHTSLTPVAGMTSFLAGGAHGNTDLLLSSQAIF